MIVIVMGVSGCGKSSVAQAIASQNGWQFIEGDDLHPKANRAKMAAGIPLDDSDRWPWLDTIAKRASRIDAEGGTAVVACSALKRTYRDRLRQAGSHVRFIHLHGERDVIAARMAARQGHFMPPGLLDSQFATLELPAPDEPVMTIEITAPIADIATRAQRELARPL